LLAELTSFRSAFLDEASTLPGRGEIRIPNTFRVYSRHVEQETKIRLWNSPIPLIAR
jgi:hypothetical protein